MVFAIFDGPAVGQSPNERVVLAQVNVRITAAVAGDVITISVADVVGQDEIFANDNNDPIFVSSRIDHTIVIEGDDGPPAFVEIADGLGRINPLTDRADTFISPLGDSVPHISFTLTMTTSLTNLSSNVAVYTGKGVPPTILWFEPLGGGRHNVLLSHSVEPGNWLRLTLRATGAGGDTTFDVWLAHQPLDFNQDGCTNVQDATAFGQEFNGDRRSALIDINGDGQVNVQDATSFGNVWYGRPPDGPTSWAYTCLDDKP